MLLSRASKFWAQAQTKRTQPRGPVSDNKPVLQTVAQLAPSGYSFALRGPHRLEAQDTALSRL